MKLTSNLSGDVSSLTPPGKDNTAIKIDPGPYVAIVKNNKDPLRMGRLEVLIPSLTKASDVDQKQLITCEYLSPFYGAKSQRYMDNKDPGNYKSSQHSYGFWAVPPDIDSKVLVIFAEGQITQAYWIGCIMEPLTNQMTPGIGALDQAAVPEGSKSKESLYGTGKLPVGETNRLYRESLGENVRDSRTKYPVHPSAEILRQQGLINDDVRGTTTSSSRRESPSAVFGMSTPGRRDQSSSAKVMGPKDSVNREIIDRLTGHTFVMDDGDSQGNNQLVRLRTSSGHQILMHDTPGDEVVYISHGSGNAWIELDKSGSIDIYSGGTLSVRSRGDLNLHSDADINMFAGNRLRMRSLNKLVIDGASITQYADTDIQSQATVGSITQKAPNGNIFSYASQNQIHQASGVHHLTGSQVHFNSIGTNANFFGPDIQRTDTLASNGTNTLHSFNQDVDIRNKGEDRPLAVNPQGMVTMSGMRTPTHEPYIHWSQTKFAIGSAPGRNTKIPGTPEYLAQRNRESDSQIIKDAQYQADLQFEIDSKKDQHKGDADAIRKIATAFTKNYNSTYEIPEGIGSVLSTRSDLLNQTIQSVTGSQLNLLKDQVFVNKSGILYTVGNLSQPITGTTSGVINDLSKGTGVFTTVGNVLSDTGLKVEGIVPGLGNVNSAINTVNTVTNTYKNIVSGNVVGVTQIKSVVSNIGTTVGKVARSVGKIFGF